MFHSNRGFCVPNTVYLPVEQGAAGAAHRLGGKGVVKLDPLSGQGVQVGGDGQGLAEAAAGVPPLLVGKIEDNIIGHKQSLPL